MVEVPRFVQLRCEMGGTQTVARIVAIVQATAVVKKREEFNDHRLRPGALRQLQPDPTHSGPMGRAMNAPPMKLELTADASHQVVGQDGWAAAAGGCLGAHEALEDLARRRWDRGAS